jgi:hypothetical protein
MRAATARAGAVAPAAWPVPPGGADMEVGAACSGASDWSTCLVWIRI